MIVVGLVVGVASVSKAATTTDCSNYTFTKALKAGSRGTEVTCLQTKLAVPSITGYYGPMTKAAVIAFQKNNSIATTGTVGPLTRAALNSGTVPTPGGNPDLCPNGMTLVSNCTLPPTGGTPVVTGPVSVALATDNPVAGYVIGNQATADLAHFTFTGAGTVNSITLTRTGISDQNTLTNVYLYNGMTRLTDGYSFNNAGTLTMNNLGLVVTGPVTISVKADIASNAVNTASTIGVTLTSYTAGTTVSTANVAGNMMYVGTGSPATVYVDATQQTVGTGNVNAGTSAYTVWSNNMQVNTRAITLKGANFRMIGSAPVDALQNIKLFVDGLQVGTTATVSSITGSNYAMFDFSAAPLTLTTGSHTVDVRADVVKGSSYTVQVSLQQAADLVLYDSQLGMNVAASKNSTASFVSSNAGTITILAGSASVVIDPTFSAMTNITGGATNTVIAKFKVHGYGEDVKVTTASILPVMSNTPTLATGSCTAGTDCSVNNVTLYFNGSQVGSQQNWNGASGNVLSFNLGSQMIIPAAVDSYIEVRADLQNASNVNYTGGSVAATLKLGSSNGQGQNSHTTLNFPTSDVAGTSLAIQTGLLAVSKSANYSSQNANPNTAGVKLGSYTLQNQSSSEGVRVTSLVVALSGTTPLTNLSNLRTSETSGSGATPVQPTATNTFSVDFTLAPGTTKTIDILGDTSTDTGHTAITSLVVTSIGSNSHVSVLQNGNGTAVPGQTITLAAGVINTTPTLLAASATTAQFIAAANGGATDATKATYNFAATGGSATISELKFTATGSTTITSVRVGTVSAPVVGGVAYLTGLSLVVPNGSSGLNQDVYVSYPEVGTNGVVSGTTSQLSLTYVKYTSGGTTTTFSPSIVAPTMTLVGSKPTITASKPSSVLSASAVEAIDITVAADAKGNLTLNSLPITVALNNATVTAASTTNITVKDSSNQTLAGANTAFGATSGGTATFTFTAPYVIQAGQSQTFKVYVTLATMTGTGVNGASMSTTPAATLGFSWLDTAGSAGSPQTGVTNIPSYPSTFTAVIYN